jgi:hypothetical protein
MERYYKGHLHKKDTLRSTNRGGVVKLTWEDIKDHTYSQDEMDGSDDKEESEDEKPRKRQRLADKENDETREPVTTTISFPGLRSSKWVRNTAVSNHTQRGLVVRQRFFAT